MSRRPADGRMHVVVYTNAHYKGGAEMTLGAITEE